MRPAYSVILFTTSSGAGYGVLAVLGIMLALDLDPAPPGVTLLASAMGLALATLGLVASTFHLGRPERAWRAFSQWRTSWLSREGVAAIAVYATAVPLTALAWWWPQHVLTRVLGVATALLALATILCTSMIYASLKTVPQWRHPTVPAVYLLLGMATGSLLLHAIFTLGGATAMLLQWFATAALAGACLAKECYWHANANRAPELTTAAATGLSNLGTVRLLDPPHTEANYLLREFGYVVARRHAERLRRLARLTAFAMPIGLSLALLLPSLPLLLQAALTVLAATSAFLGALIERWLFFAEARHTVMLYYGAGAL